MMKKCTAVLLAMLLALTATACSASNQSYYEQAQLYLGSGEYGMAEMLFSQLGEYEDAADYALYSAALAAFHSGDRALAQANFTLVRPFKSSERYLAYLEAVAREEANDLDGALALWEELGSFEDSAEKAAALREAIPTEEIAHARALMEAGRYEQARALLETLNGYGESPDLLAQCAKAILQAAYDKAEGLYASGRFNEAMLAFEALGDTLDAAQRALDCRAALYEALEAAYPSATLATALDLMDGYAEMEDYQDSAARLADLQARFGTTIALLEDVTAWPWVRFGQYPILETGAPSPVLWRLLSVDGATATLLCDSVLDALPATSLPTLMLSAHEQEALLSLSLPLLTDLAALAPEDLRCPATPYALAQGVRHHSDGSAWWWLGNPVDAGRNAIIWYNGNILDTGVAVTEAAVGVRPILRVDLDALMLSQGDGSLEHPYQ